MEFDRDTTTGDSAKDVQCMVNFKYLSSSWASGLARFLLFSLEMHSYLNAWSIGELSRTPIGI